VHRRPGRSDSGFTLIELLVTLSIGAALFGLAGTSLSSWSSANAHKASRDEAVSALRNAAQRALSEGRTYCLSFAADGTWKTYRTSCGAAGVLISSGQGLNNKGSALAPAFTYLAGQTSDCTTAATPTSCAYFYPRGTASAGTVTVTRSGKPTYTVTVEQLTSRVYTN
jgi:prepilin-type N-terminal cleavage/methylation domain-containing protein